MKTFYIRAASAVVFLIIMVGCIMFGGWLFFCLLMLFILDGSVREYFKITSLKDQLSGSIKWFYTLPVVVSTLVFFPRITGISSTTQDIFILSFVATAVFAFIIFVAQLLGKENSFLGLGDKLVPLFWLVIPMQLIVLIYSAKGPWLVLSVFSIIWFYDSACYIVGSLIGKHKMIERISPKKTWEGLAGGVVLTLTGAFFLNKIPQLNIYTSWQWVILAFVIIIAATFGDLVESLFKRGFGIKDSGTMMPGHGGYLDRFDAFFFAVPFASLVIFLLDKFK